MSERTISLIIYFVVVAGIASALFLDLGALR